MGQRKNPAITKKRKIDAFSVVVDNAAADDDDDGVDVMKCGVDKDLGQLLKIGRCEDYYEMTRGGIWSSFYKWKIKAKPFFSTSCNQNAHQMNDLQMLL